MFWCAAIAAYKNTWGKKKIYIYIYIYIRTYVQGLYTMYMKINLKRLSFFFFFGGGGDDTYKYMY